MSLPNENTDFSAEDPDDEEASTASPRATDGAPAAALKNYITPAGESRLRKELLQLLDIDRPVVVETVHWAAKNGDRSENGDYIYGKTPA